MHHNSTVRVLTTYFIPIKSLFKNHLHCYNFLVIDDGVLLLLHLHIFRTQILQKNPHKNVRP